MNGNLIVCQNSCIQVGTNPVPGINYQWSPVAGLSDPFATVPWPVWNRHSQLHTYRFQSNRLRVSQDLVIGVSPLPAADQHTGYYRMYGVTAPSSLILSFTSGPLPLPVGRMMAAYPTYV